ncbi:MAG: nuclear transport factor 2 family protein [Proteobacteria bacterium]|nr:MAG: nuclear transport factor 2 family protein [Pseudomonadota bacterium]
MELNLQSSFDDVIALEKRLLEPSIRSDLEELDRILDDSFVEFGTSGRRYGKSDILNLLARDNSSFIDAYDFEPIALAIDLIQLRFKTRRKLDGGETFASLRSSIWRKSQCGWRMIFHQGTATES